MADESHDADNVSVRSGRTVCYVAALDPTLRTPSPEPFVEDAEDENEFDPAFHLLLEQSKSLKEIFQKRSLEYGQLKYELRRARDIYDHLYRIDFNVSSTILATEEILEVSNFTFRDLDSHLSRQKRQQKEFFGSRVTRVRATFEQLERLAEDNEVLLEKLRVLHYPVEEFQHIARRDRLMRSQNNFDFVIKELCEELSAFLSSRSAITYSE
ncbi:unnamed protein product [Aureobasidium uvarum]|uniref:Uncharacterized protein n=1 Tax=Aureobasidium uvarum TaxID=2773716 RepID=A0A9N8KF67_9PEZI|nr:unnamed protein product [Aureobasidium uvarum]